MKKIKINKNILNFSIPLCLALPLMVIEMINMIKGHIFSLPVYSLSYDWICFIIAAIVIFYFGKEYYKYCFYEIFKLKTVGMSTLIVLSTFLSFTYSVYLLIYKTILFANNPNQINHIMSFFEIGATIIAIVNSGEYIALKIREKSNQDINNISKLLISNALLFDESKDTYKEVETKSLQINDLVFVKKGTKIPIDGHLYKNPSDVDESLITGETNAIFKNVGDKLIGGSINLTNDLIIKVSSTQNNSVIQNIINNIKENEQKKNKTQRIVDRISKFFTPTIIACALLAFILQLVSPDLLNISSITGLFGNTDLNWINGENQLAVNAQKGLYFFIATLTISCPCALGIAAPLASLIGVSKGAKNGIIFNNTDVFEKIKNIDRVVFDKTGTLTTGNLKVTKFIGDIKNLTTIYQMQKISFHPISKSIINFCNENKNFELKKTNDEFIEIPGVGIKNKNNNQFICSLKYAIDNNFEIDKSIVNEYEEYKSEQNDSIKIVSVFVIKNKIVNFIFMNDEIRKDAYRIISLLKKKKIDVVMITGDNEDNAKFVANKLHINNYYSNTSPSQKKVIIEQMQNNNHKVLYVGDGINDLEALNKADISISITNDNEAAKSISDINLIYLNINSVYNAIRIAKQTRVATILNLVWAFGYNIAFVPLAILGFIPAIVGVYIMMLSDITVNLNSLIFKLIK